MYALWLSNHPCSEEQREEMERLFDCPVMELGPEAKSLWGSVPPTADMDFIQNLFSRILEVEGVNIKEVKVFAVMGELSLCVAAIRVGALFGIRVCTTTTFRESTEDRMPDGTVRKTNVFRHCRIRTIV